MGLDLSVQFDDLACYATNATRFVKMATELPSALATSPSPHEVWLKTKDSADPWEYDARILFKEDRIEIEVLGFGASFHVDIRRFIAQISNVCSATLVDDDGEPF